MLLAKLPESHLAFKTGAGKIKKNQKKKNRTVNLGGWSHLMHPTSNDGFDLIDYLLYYSFYH